MAKIEEIVNDVETKRPAKKTTKVPAKGKLAFNVGTPVVGETVKEAVIKGEPIINKTAPVADKVKANTSLPVEEVKLPTNVDSVDALNSHVSREHEQLQAAKAKAATLPKVNNSTPAKVSNTPISKPAYNRNFHKPSSIESRPAVGQYPEHMVEIALIIKNNAEIRRFTSLGVLNYLYQKKEIKTPKGFVVFKWNKFTVQINNLDKDYEYSESFFINCLVASFASFAASAQKTLNNFTIKEMNQGLGEVMLSDEELEVISQSTSKG